MNQAIIDIGSNTVKVHFYHIGTPPYFERFDSLTRPVKLIEYIENGNMNAQGIELLCATLSDFLDHAHRHGCDQVHAFATASLRRANNADEIISHVARRTGIAIDLIDGELEARLSYSGVLHEVGSAAGILLDMGGGSTEVIVFDGQAVSTLFSMPFGSLSLRRDFVEDEFPSTEETDRIRGYVRDQFRACAVGDSDTLYIAGGTGRAICKIDASFGAKTADGVYRMTADALYQLQARLTADPVAAMHLLTALTPERKTTLIPGLCALCAIAHDASAQSIVFPTSGVREGYLLSII